MNGELLFANRQSLATLLDGVKGQSNRIQDELILFLQGKLANAPPYNKIRALAECLEGEDKVSDAEAQKINLQTEFDVRKADIAETEVAAKATTNAFNNVYAKVNEIMSILDTANGDKIGFFNENGLLYQKQLNGDQTILTTPVVIPFAPYRDNVENAFQTSTGAVKDFTSKGLAQLLDNETYDYETRMLDFAAQLSELKKDKLAIAKELQELPHDAQIEYLAKGSALYVFLMNVVSLRDTEAPAIPMIDEDCEGYMSLLRDRFAIVTSNRNKTASESIPSQMVNMTTPSGNYSIEAKLLSHFHALLLDGRADPRLLRSSTFRTRLAKEREFEDNECTRAVNMCNLSILSNVNPLLWRAAEGMPTSGTVELLYKAWINNGMQPLSYELIMSSLLTQSGNYTYEPIFSRVEASNKPSNDYMKDDEPHEEMLLPRLARAFIPNADAKQEASAENSAIGQLIGNDDENDDDIDFEDDGMSN
jgi:hypothetical protein